MLVKIYHIGLMNQQENLKPKLMLKPDKKYITLQWEHFLI